MRMLLGLASAEAAQTACQDFQQLIGTVLQCIRSMLSPASGCSREKTCHAAHLAARPREALHLHCCKQEFRCE